MTPEAPPATAVDVNAIDPTLTHQVGEFKHEIALTTLRVDPTDRFVAAGAEDVSTALLAETSER